MACAQNSRKAADETFSSHAAGATAASPECKPIETRRANSPDQKPTFPGQTRACAVKSNVAFDVTVVAAGLVHPWAVEPMPNGDFLITERPGRLRIVAANGEIGPPIGGLLPVGSGGLSKTSAAGGLPPIAARGQGGLLDIALSPDFAQDRTIFWSFSEQREDGNGTSVARGRLTDDRKNLEQVRVIFRAQPTYNNGLHFGSRLAFGPDNMLYITLGDRFDRPNRPKAQQLDTHLGKIIRIDPDGSVPADNPFVKQAGAMPEIWTIGHRNIQSAAFDDRGRLWTVEMGPQGGDELNLIEKGKNYGWPLVTFGEEYSDDPVPGAVTAREGYENPVYYWDPVIAPSGAQFYTGEAFPAWRGSLFVGALREQRLVRLVIQGDRITGEEHLLTERGQRIRDVRQGPDGALYIVTDETNGELWKIMPRAIGSLSEIDR
ncbi:MAG: PQQ-dependent sugar dehydrogenase [Synechococcales cyanobacterium RU_4_20]|nr:PQQ-dependent sugar dehydrogenase [Synechococcales cyanobacterium RU_4_20]